MEKENSKEALISFFSFAFGKNSKWTLAGKIVMSPILALACLGACIGFLLESVFIKND